MKSGRVRGLVETALAMLLAGAGSLLWAAARPRPTLAGAGASEPPPGLPPARIVPVPGRGEFFVREAPGPLSDPAAAPTVVLLHGWMYPADAHWFAAYGPLAEHARLIAMDHRGHGRGPRPATPFRLVDVADDVAALLDTLGIEQAVVVGYSMGGAVAQLLWQRHPRKVAGLVLVASSATFNTSARDRWIWRGMGLLQVLLRLAPRHVLERLALAQADGRLALPISRMISADSPPAVKQLLPWLIGEFDRGSAEDIAEAGRELSRYDARGWISTLDVPAAVIVTTQDVLVPAGNQRDLAQRIPDAFVQEVPLDHDAVVAAPEILVPALRKAIGHVTARCVA